MNLEINIRSLGEVFNSTTASIGNLLLNIDCIKFTPYRLMNMQNKGLHQTQHDMTVASRQGLPFASVLLQSKLN